MAPKKHNAFSVYMREIHQSLARQGIKKNMSEMPEYCKKGWEEMTDQMKAEYKSKSRNMNSEDKIQKYTSLGEKVEDIKKKSEDNILQNQNMYLYIEELVKVYPANLCKQMFILIHINPYTCESDKFYFPAEISMSEFSLERGLIRNFHQLIGFDKIRTNAPPASTGDINNHAKNNHLIDTFTKLPNNYTEIFLKIIGFIIGKDVNKDVLNDSTLDLPPIYTAHTFTGNELMITNSCLYNLYQCCGYDVRKDDFKNLIRVYHLDKLFMELKNMSYNMSYNIKDPVNIEKALPSVSLATDYLSKDMFSTIKSVGCFFHINLQYEHICSNYFVCKWIYIISTHCCQYFNIDLISGCHYDFDLSKTKLPAGEIIESQTVSPTTYFMNNDKEKKSQALTANSFPALDGVLSTNIQQPMWSRPEHKINTLTKPVANKDDEFPPLGNSQRPIPENSSITEKNSWYTNFGHGRGVKHVQNSESSKTTSKGRGFRHEGNK